MLAYILRRILLMIPTLLGINADLLRHHPVRPRRPLVERIIAQLQGTDAGATSRISGGGGDLAGGGGGGETTSAYRGAQGLDPQFIAELEAQFGFDKPAHERFGLD